MALISDSGILIKCPHCGATQKTGTIFDLNMHYCWKNAHGAKIRLFCKLCGQWTDVTAKNGEVVKTVIVKPSPFPEIKELASLFNNADALLEAKIEQANGDRRESEGMLIPPQRTTETEPLHRKHVDIMNSYVFDLERERRELYEEYKAEIDRVKTAKAD